MRKTAASGEAKVAGERSRLPGIGIGSIGTGRHVPFSLVFFHHVTGLSPTVVGLVMTVTGPVGPAFVPLAGPAAA
ncbi:MULTISPECIES: hypothetical protein [unclassified Streptomyces]|uniref:hypothetical protein n=1 Tax=unclassified Streptomyces TaxID=2593676 RepID=UPI002E2844CA|nr:hypothetical protein [Streptomyces sp. NBC_01439]